MDYIVQDLISNTGRVKNNILTSFIKNATQERFCSVFTHPMLISELLYEGQLSKGLNSRSTMVFSVKALRDQMKSKQNAPSTNGPKTEEHSNHAIFALRKNRDNITPMYSFSIGRMIPNDIIIPDYTISKQHSAIVLHEGNYHIYELGSTNGTLVAGIALEKNQPKLLKSGDRITFGRLGYVFLTADRIYELLKC